MVFNPDCILGGNSVYLSEQNTVMQLLSGILPSRIIPTEPGFTISSAGITLSSMIIFFRATTQKSYFTE